MIVENPDVFDDPKSIYYARDSHLDDGSALVAVLEFFPTATLISLINRTKISMNRKNRNKKRSRSEKCLGASIQMQ